MVSSSSRCERVDEGFISILGRGAGDDGDGDEVAEDYGEG